MKPLKTMHPLMFDMVRQLNAFQKALASSVAKNREDGARISSENIADMEARIAAFDESQHPVGVRYEVQRSSLPEFANGWWIVTVLDNGIFEGQYWDKDPIGPFFKKEDGERELAALLDAGKLYTNKL